MNDKELLELAAKAAGIEKDDYVHENGALIRHTYSKAWNPLTDDGDALRLAVKLGIDVEFWLSFETVEASPQNVPFDSIEEPFGDNPYAATRRAIVRAAAEIGRTMG